MAALHAARKRRKNDNPGEDDALIETFADVRYETGRTAVDNEQTKVKNMHTHS